MADTISILRRFPCSGNDTFCRFGFLAVEKLAQRLRAQPGKHIWMMGGGEIIASFLDHGEIDEFRINVIPIPVAQPSGCAVLTFSSAFVCRRVSAF